MSVRTQTKRKKARNTGGNVNYYLVEVTHPKREGVEPYTMEVEDIIEALDMNFHEGTILKSLIRSCVARKTGEMKENYDGPIYDTEKIAHSAGRRKVRLELKERGEIE